MWSEIKFALYIMVCNPSDQIQLYFSKQKRVEYGIQCKKVKICH